MEFHLAFLVLSLACFPARAQPAEQILYKIDLNRYPNARCLDGSPGAFYLWRASNPASSRKWSIHHGGGGWCSANVPFLQTVMVDSCLARSGTSFGSSAPYYPLSPEKLTGALPKDTNVAPDPAANPMMHDWNKVFLVYCDGGSFSGRRVQPFPSEGKPLYFQGSYILDAAMDMLLHEHGMSSATDVVIGGASAGGLATYLHLDKWRAAIPPAAFVAGLSDGGFFLDWDSTKSPQAAHTYADELRASYVTFNASVHPGCVTARATGQAQGSPSDCYFAEHVLPFISTPVFAAQSTMDSWQMGQELGSSFPADLMKYRDAMSSRIRTKLLTNPRRGAFLDSCVHHTAMWDVLVANGTRLADAFPIWYNQQRAAWAHGTVPPVQTWEQDWPCYNCCGPPDATTVARRLDVDNAITAVEGVSQGTLMV